MENSKPASNKPVSRSTYIYIAIVGFILSLAVIYYYLRFIEGKVSGQTDQKIFYLILILFGIAASAVIFGLMNSYATLRGEQMNAKYKFTGPIVGVLLTVLGGFYLPKPSAEKIVTIRAFNERNQPVKSGEVKIYLPGYIRTQAIDNLGQAQFADIPESISSNRVRIDVLSPGFIDLSLDTQITYSRIPIEVRLSPLTSIQLTGRVKDAGEVPIKNVEVYVEGSKFSAYSITDGTYSLELKDYSVGDVITLTTSHEKFEDKTMTIRISQPEMSVDFVLKEINSQ